MSSFEMKRGYALAIVGILQSKPSDKIVTVRQVKLKPEHYGFWMDQILINLTPRENFLETKKFPTINGVQIRRVSRSGCSLNWEAQAPTLN